jgi:predicted RNA-binding protein YlxR (DUF448 family)
MARATAVRTRPLPQRTCVACGRVSAKREFVRIVRTTENRVLPDPTGKKPGRGAYLCQQPSCWEQAIKKGRLERSLKVSILSEDAEGLRAFAAGIEVTP